MTTPRPARRRNRAGQHGPSAGCHTPRMVQRLRSKGWGLVRHAGHQLLRVLPEAFEDGWDTRGDLWLCKPHVWGAYRWVQAACSGDAQMRELVGQPPVARASWPLLAGLWAHTAQGARPEHLMAAYSLGGLAAVQAMLQPHLPELERRCGVRRVTT